MTAAELAADPTGRREELLVVDELTVEVSTETGWVPVVDRLSLQVHRGETVGIVGESGSGKTLTALAMMNLLPAGARLAGGTMSLAGPRLSAASEKGWRRRRGQAVAMIFQEPRRALNPAFTVGEQVAEPIRAHLGLSRRAAMRRVAELFEMVEIAEPTRRMKQYPHEFSGGMCQRVMLAIALACSPSLLIADEPTTALDVTVQRQVLQLVNRLQDELGFGVLLITHDLGVVAEMCHRVNVMYAGQVIESRDVDSLFYDPRHPYTAALLSTVLDGERTTRGHIPGVVPPPHLFPTGCRFEPRCGFAQDDCRLPQEPTALRGPDRVRCGRHQELSLEGVDVV